MSAGSLVFPLIYGGLASALFIAWFLFFAHSWLELKRVSAWPALLFATASCTYGVWGLLHLSELQRRNFLDFAFERCGAGIAYVGFASAIVWVLRSRCWSSWITLGVAACLSLLWTGACASL